MKDKPIRTVFLLQDLEFGGTQRYALNLLKYLDREIFSPELWVLRGGEDMLPLAKEIGLKVHFLSKSSWVGPQAIIPLAWKLFRDPPDLIYTLTVVPSIWGRVFAHFAGTQTVVSGYRNLSPKQFDRFLWRLNNCMICNCEAAKKVLTETHGADPNIVVVVPNGVDTDYFCPPIQPRASKPTVLYVGRFVKEKDPLTLAEAFRLTAANVPGARFIMIGNGPIRSELEKFIITHGLQSVFELYNGTSEVRSYLWDAWVFAIASKSDSSPNVVLEAMSTGMPVVATRVGGLPEIVHNGETGLLVDPGNPHELAESLTSLLTDQNLRETMGNAARARAVAHHSLKYTAKLTQDALVAAVRSAKG